MVSKFTALCGYNGPGHPRDPQPATRAEVKAPTRRSSEVGKTHRSKSDSTAVSTGPEISARDHNQQVWDSQFTEAECLAVGIDPQAITIKDAVRFGRLLLNRVEDAERVFLLLMNPHENDEPLGLFNLERDDDQQALQETFEGEITQGYAPMGYVVVTASTALTIPYYGAPFQFMSKAECDEYCTSTYNVVVELAAKQLPSHPAPPINPTTNNGWIN